MRAKNFSCVRVRVRVRATTGWGEGEGARDLLVRAGLDVDPAHVCAQQPCAVLHHDGLHLALIVLHVDLRLLADERHVDVADTVPSVDHASVGLRGPVRLGVGVSG